MRCQPQSPKIQKSSLYPSFNKALIADTKAKKKRKTYHLNRRRPLINRNLILPRKIVQMPQQARHHLRQAGIRLRARRRDHRVRERGIEARRLRGIRSAAGVAACGHAGARLIGDQVQGLGDHCGGYAGADGEVVFGGGRGEEEVFDGAEGEEEGGGLVRVRGRTKTTVDETDFQRMNLLV